MDGIVGKVSAFGPSGWQCGKSFSEVQCWNRIEAVRQMKTTWALWHFENSPVADWEGLWYNVDVFVDGGVRQNGE